MSVEIDFYPILSMFPLDDVNFAVKNKGVVLVLPMLSHTPIFFMQDIRNIAIIAQAQNCQKSIPISKFCNRISLKNALNSYFCFAKYSALPKQHLG